MDGSIFDAYLLHDARLALGESDVTARFVLDELDLDLPSLTAGFIIVIIVIVGGIALALTLGAAALDGTAVLQVVVLLVGVGVVADDFGRLRRRRGQSM